MISTKTVRQIIIVVVALIVVISIFTMIRNSGSSPVNQVSKEEVVCLSAVCTVDSTYGQNCAEFSPRIAHVYQTTDVNESGAHRLVINLNDNTCKD